MLILLAGCLPDKILLALGRSDLGTAGVLDGILHALGLGERLGMGTGTILLMLNSHAADEEDDDKEEAAAELLIFLFVFRRKKQP